MLRALEGELRGLLEVVASGQKSWLPTQGNTSWTRKITSHVCALGHEWGFKVSASDCDEADAPQLLFDLVISRRRRDSGHENLFVMNAEWSPDSCDITWDFGQLLLVQAPLKLFLYQQPNESHVAETMSTLDRLAQSFRVRTPGERYLLAGYSWAGRRFEYASVVV